MTVSKTLIFCCLIAIACADCSCNSTDINQTWPCACQDIEGYKICKQSHDTAINYTNTLISLVKPYLDDYYYAYFASNLELSFPAVYCTGITTCYVDSSNDTCRRNYYYADCNMIKNIVSTMSEQSSKVFFDKNIKKIISDETLRINVSISCDFLNQNSITVNNNIKNTNSSNTTKISIHIVLISLLNFLVFVFF